MIDLGHNICKPDAMGFEMLVEEFGMRYTAEQELFVLELRNAKLNVIERHLWNLYL